MHVCNNPDNTLFRRISRSLARWLTRIIDRLYLPCLHKILPLQTFRYAACGSANLVLSWVLYYMTFHYIVKKEVVEMGFVAISSHIAAFLIVFPITYLTGFWLQKCIAFKTSPLLTRTQLFRYLLSVLGSLLLNYAGLKFFVEILHFYSTPSQMVTSLITIVYSYLMQKYFTFRGCDGTY